VGGLEADLGSSWLLCLGGRWLDLQEIEHRLRKSQAIRLRDILEERLKSRLALSITLPHNAHNRSNHSTHAHKVWKTRRVASTFSPPSRLLPGNLGKALSIL
jgi:hypothetical protein